MAPVLINCSRSFWGSRSSIGVDLGGGGSEIWISTFPAIKKKKRITDVAVEPQHPGLPSGSGPSCVGAARLSVRGTRGTIAPSFFQIRNRIFALPRAPLPAGTVPATRLWAPKQFPDTQTVQEELQRGLENVLSFL